MGAVRETVAEHRKNRTPAAGAGAGAAQAAGGAVGGTRLPSRVARLYGRTVEVGSNPSAELCQVHAENQRGRFFADVCPEPVLANDRVSEDELKERDVFFLLAGRNRARQAHDLGSFLRSALYPRAQVREQTPCFRPAISQGINGDLPRQARDELSDRPCLSQRWAVANGELVRQQRPPCR